MSDQSPRDEPEQQPETPPVMQRTYEVKDGKWSDIGAFALGAMETVAASHPSPEVREFAQQQLDGWVRHGFIEEES